MKVAMRLGLALVFSVFAIIALMLSPLKAAVALV